MDGRFDDLMADLSAELDAALAAELAAEVADRTRFELGRVRLVDRLRAAGGRELTFATGAGPLRGVVRAVGADWCGLTEGPGREALLPLGAVRFVRGLPMASAAPPAGPALDDRLELRLALRRLARDRAVVRLAVGPESLTGTLDRVGADYLELALHELVERRPAAAPVAVVPTAAVNWVRWG